MLDDGTLLLEIKKLIELKVCWGDSNSWANQDFIELSKKIHNETGASLSHATLKRLWGKVKYEGLPQVYTLNTLARFAGYESWRDFIVKQGNIVIQTVPGRISPIRRKPRQLWKSATFVTGIAGIVILMLFVFRRSNNVNKADYALSSRTTLTAGIPNSVVFNYDAGKSPDDSVILQQSWDTTLRTRVSKNQHQHTLIYYFPGFFRPKLIVAGKIVKEEDLLIKSDGWVTAVMAKPMPVYFRKQDIITNGKMSLPISRIKAQQISFGSQVPQLSYCNVQDFGEIYSDDFVFETAVRNDYRDGASVCQMTNIYLLCKGTAINIPLCAKGCESSLNFFFTGYAVSGKDKDLSAFGVNNNDFSKIRVIAAGGKAKIFLDNKLAYVVPHSVDRSKIIGFDFVFQGSGSVDYVRLSNNRVHFYDEF